MTRSVAVLEAMSHAPKELTQELEKPFAERCSVPLQERAVEIGRRLSGADAAERIRRKLDLAGNPAGWTVDRVLSGKVIGAVALPRSAACVFQLMLSGPAVKVDHCRSPASSWAASRPNLYLYQKVHDRAGQMQRELPDAIDLLTISVESGLAFDAAVQQVARNTKGPLAEEFCRVLREMQIGQGRAEALRGVRRPHQRRRRAHLRHRHGAGRHLRHPDRRRCCGCSPPRCGSSADSGPRRRPRRCR